MQSHVVIVFVQDRMNELTGASLVVGGRYGLEQPQPQVDTAALAALINVPTGQTPLLQITVNHYCK